MKKKLFIILMSTALTLTACGDQNTELPSSQTTSQSSVQPSESTAISTESSSDLSDLEALGSVEVDKGLIDVEFTIPKDFVGETTQEELDTLCKENNFKSITLNEDGSATYIMSKAQHKEYMEQYKAELNKSLSELVGSESYPNFTEIKANDDFTEFTVTTKSAELDMSESFSVLAFYMYGGMYNIFNGTPADNVTVTFVNADSGEVISTSNSADSEN